MHSWCEDDAFEGCRPWCQDSYIRFPFERHFPEQTNTF